jgi:acyl-CoA thioesterase I
MINSLARWAVISLSLLAIRAWADKPVLLIVGDSLSAAYNIDPEHSWPAYLQARLPGYKVVNRSISGATTAQGLALLPTAIKDYQPQVVLLELGANDGLQGKPLALIEDNLNQLLQQAKAQTSKVVLIGIRLPPNLGKRYTEGFYAIYPRLALKYEIGLVPFLLEGVAGNAALMQADGLHPTEAAQQQVLANIWPLVEPLAKPQTQGKPESTDVKKPSESP